jgi:hypothetical protein
MTLTLGQQRRPWPAGVVTEIGVFRPRCTNSLLNFLLADDLNIKRSAGRLLFLNDATGSRQPNKSTAWSPWSLEAEQPNFRLTEP